MATLSTNYKQRPDLDHPCAFSSSSSSPSPSSSLPGCLTSLAAGTLGGGMLNIMATLHGCLKYSYKNAWQHVLSIFAKMFSVCPGLLRVPSHFFFLVFLFTALLCGLNQAWSDRAVSASIFISFYFPTSLHLFQRLFFKAKFVWCVCVCVSRRSILGLRAIHWDAVQF